MDNIKSNNLDEFVESLNNINLDTNKLEEFNEEYSKLAIINPNKYKFSETVLEQYYYQMIRSFSYELEKKQSVLIVFGFSFADEHIKDIFERSLLNPELIVIMICYSSDSMKEMKRKFHGYNNIKFLPDDFNKNSGDFNYLLKLLGVNYEV
ncbi:SIR2 family protein [Anaerococcus sp. NML200537]|uniref:SIR2 family protein n=1 Tax=Anaerococcus sp. NML200537 TaxID=2954485 RepID=UPI002238637B|nr:SIR2 family protein [Anaerococcus sp. NML200537]MCW6700920.1 SIR2 family protein [Anaerococcus sp. NML200537]